MKPLLLSLVLILAGCNIEVMPKEEVPSPKILRLTGCSSNHLITTAHFEKRGKDQVLILQCGRSKDPKNPK